MRSTLWILLTTSSSIIWVFWNILVNNYDFQPSLALSLFGYLAQYIRYVAPHDSSLQVLSSSELVDTNQPTDRVSIRAIPVRMQCGTGLILEIHVHEPHLHSLHPQRKGNKALHQKQYWNHVMLRDWQLDQLTIDPVVAWRCLPPSHKIKEDQ